MFASPVALRAESFPTQRDESINDTTAGMRILQSLVAELDRAGFTPHRVRDVEVAFTEALVNAIRHGNQGDSRKWVRIQYQIDTAGLWLSIEDQGQGFQPDQVADPTLTENLDRPGGRGLLLMKSLMSHVEFNSRGNHVVLRLWKHAA